MTAYDLSPAFVRLFYASGTRTHVQTLPVKFAGVPVIGTMPDLEDYAGGSGTALARLTAYITQIKTLCPAIVTWTGYEVYKKNIGEEPVFVFGDDLAIVGTNVNAQQPYSQETFTFRTDAGGVGKIVVLDTSIIPNSRQAARTTATAPLGAIVTYLLSSSNFIFGRDNGRYVSGIWITSKTNDALRKKAILDN